MTLNWTALEIEFARWEAANLSLPFWWRDDDAVAPTPALTRLAELAEKHQLPVHLAVIPSAVKAELADTVAAHPLLIPVVHGWAHANHAPKFEKKAEFGAHRPLGQMRAESRRAMRGLSDLFGPALTAMFVPPWNRVPPDLLPHLSGLGYEMVSTFAPRQAPFAAPGLAQINTHLDPINWRGDKGLVAPDTLIAQIARQLADRRLGNADNTEPFGILTHHLVHDEAIWSFTNDLMCRLLAGPTHRWSAPKKDPMNEPT